MSDLSVTVNGKAISVPQGAMIAAAVLRAGETAFRLSRNGEPRGPLCGMGICYECRVTVNGVRHVRSCQVPCESGMEITTG